MANTSVSLAQPEALKENKLSIHGYLKQSYTQTKKELQNGMTVFKDELPEIYDRNSYSYCAGRMLLPVNNFLKDGTQMEEDFRDELNKEDLLLHTNTASIIPIEQALTSGKMEENY